MTKTATKAIEAFRAGSDPEMNASIEWIHMFDLDSSVADAFKEAADLIVAGLKSREGPKLHVDPHLFTVGYNYRHYLELKLKGIVEAGIQMNLIKVNRKKVMEGHNLHRLWGKFRELTVAAKMGDDPAPLNRIERVVLAFHKSDSTGQAFRYTREKETDEPHLTGLPKMVSLEYLRDAMQEVHELLDGCSMCMDAIADGIAESE